jgi:hypothetical protein
MATETAAQAPTPAPASAQTPKVPTYRIKSLTIALELACGSPVGGITSQGERTRMAETFPIFC